jgi:hypothetical protein
MRWIIEQVFRSLKSHCPRIGDSRMTEAGCFIKLSGYMPPGPKTMHHGLLLIDPILLGWRLANRFEYV